MRHAILFALLVAVIPAPAAADDPTQLLDGVSAIGTSGGLPGALAVFGPDAEVVFAAGDPRRVVVASARVGKGRAVAWAHDGYFTAKELNKAQAGVLFTNSIAWAGGKKAPRVGVVGLGDVAGWLKGKGVAPVALAGDWSRSLGNVDVLVAHAPALAGDAKQAAVRALLARGGGVLLADTGWGWAQLNPDKSLTADHPGNQLLAAAGLAWTAEAITLPPKASEFPAADRPRHLNAWHAVDFIAKEWTAVAGPKGNAARESAVSAVRLAAAAFPSPDNPIAAKIRAARAGGVVKYPSAKSPVKPFADPSAGLLVLEMIEPQLTGGKPKAHPAAATFPGAVPASARAADRTLKIDTRVPDWHGTGLYAVPGQPLTVTVPASAAKKGLRVRIGCHTDTLWHLREWKRMPDVSVSVPLNAASTEVANAMGGLVYVEVPDGCKLGEVEVSVRGAVGAPRFVLGKTTADEWLNTQLALPGPWAEFETSKLIITVPARAARTVRDPVALMRKWDEVMDACAELAAIPKDRKRPERFVVDEQISAGYMHSGYPLMAHLDVENHLVDLKSILGGAVEPVWGMFHEIGHNHQRPEWTFAGTGEVTVNLFTMYAFEKVVGRADMGLHLHNLATPARRNKLVKEHLDAGAKFADWDAKPFTALVMYIQLREGFGWETYRKVFAEYRALPAKDRPRTEQQKRDQWMVRFSKAANADLGPFFRAWGVPVTDAALAEVAGLPKWLPPDFPPK